MKFLSYLHASHFRKIITFFLKGSQVPPSAVFLRVALKMKVKMNMKMKMIKMSVEYWCNDAQRENFTVALCLHKSSKNWPRMETIVRVK
jgi:hypothetical protein